MGCSDSDDAAITGQALLSPLTNTTVDHFQYDNLDVPLYSTTTSDSTSLSGAGLFEIPESILENDMLYVVMVSGGVDIDADDDGILDDRR